MYLYKFVIPILLACKGLAFGTKKVLGTIKSGSVLLCHIWLYLMNFGSVIPGPRLTAARSFVTLKFKIVTLLLKLKWYCELFH